MQHPVSVIDDGTPTEHAEVEVRPFP